MSDCDVGSNLYTGSTSATEDVIIVATAAGRPGPATGERTHVHVSRVGKPIVLVLASEEANNWTVTKETAVVIEQIIVAGPTADPVPSVVPPDGVAVAWLGVTTKNGAHASSLPGGQELIAATKAATQRPVLAFGGCMVSGKVSVQQGSCGLGGP